MPIYFFKPHDEYGCFSNFSPHGVELDGRYWPTVEHYFQAQKFTDAAHQDLSARSATPKDAKTLGWDRATIEICWESSRRKTGHIIVRERAN